MTRSTECSPSKRRFAPTLPCTPGLPASRYCPAASLTPVPHFICPNCKERSIDIDRKEGMFDEAVACHHCGFGFLFELMDDYYPAPTTGLVTCDQEGRILAIGRGVFELSGWSESDVIGNDVVDAFGLSGFEEEKNPVKLSL